MGKSNEIHYTPRPDTTPVSELSMLCDAYRFILDSAKKNPAAGPSERGKHDGTEFEGVSADGFIIRKPEQR
jgi:hypothetical protein